MTFYVSYVTGEGKKAFATIDAINALDLHKKFALKHPKGVIIEFEKAKVHRK